MDEHSLVPRLVMIALITIGLLALVDPLLKRVNEQSDLEKCRASVIIQSKTKFLGDECNAGGTDLFWRTKSCWKLDCKRRFVDFYESEVKINFENHKVTVGRKKNQEDFDKLTDDIVNQVVAKELTDCWYQYLEGTVNFLDKDNFKFFSDKTACFMCSQIDFTDVSQQKFRGLNEYLRKTNNSKYGNLYKFLSKDTLSYKGKDKDDKVAFEDVAKVLNFNLDPVINANEDYAVMFMKKGRQSAWSFDNIRKWATFLTPQIYSSQLYNMYDKEGELFIAWIIPSSQINDYCDFP